MTMNYRKTLVRYLTAMTVVLMSLISVLSCKKEKVVGGSLQQIVITSPASGKLTLVQGETGRIKYTTVPEEAANTAILEWSSEDENVATVKNGRVIGVAPGKTVITAKCESITASVDVVVTAIPVTSFSVPSTISAYLDMLTPVDLKIKPDEANAGSMEWVSDKPEIAEVVVEDGNAFIRSHKEGTCTITVKTENLSKESKIKVTVYQTIYKLLMRTIDGKVEDLKDGTAVDVISMSLPDAEGHRVIEMVREDGGKFTETNVEISSDNTKAISVATKLRSERKVLIYIKEESSSGSAKISVSLKENGYVYKRTFTINKGVHAFTSQTKICRAYTETPVGKEEIMSPGDVLEVQIVPAVNAKWTSSNEKIAKVKARTEDGTGFAPIAEIQALTEYGTAVITATDETGKNSLSFQVNVAKPSFPAGTKIGYYDESGKLQPVGTSTSIRATRDGRYMVKFTLMDASGNVSTYDKAEWSIDSSLGELEHESGVYTELKAVAYEAFTGTKTGTLTCTDYAGNKITHNIVFQSPVVFGSRSLGSKVDGQISYENVKVDIGKKAVVAFFGTKKLPVSLSGLRWSGLETLGSYGNVKTTTTGANTVAYFEFTPSKKMESVKVTVEDELGQKQSITISSAAFQFPKDAKIYISYDKSTWKTTEDCPFMNNGGTYFRVGTSATEFAAPGVNDARIGWSYSIWKPSSITYKGNIRALPSGDVYTYAVSPVGYPNDYGYVEFNVVAEDDYGNVIKERFYLMKKLNFNDNIKFRVIYYYRDNYATHDDSEMVQYNYESGKDVYVDFPSKAQSVRICCSPYSYASTVLFSKAVIIDYDDESGQYVEITVRAKIDIWPKLNGDQYSRVELYDHYGNKKTFYVRRK